jgi:hypothetical protein
MNRLYLVTCASLVALAAACSGQRATPAPAPGEPAASAPVGTSVQPPPVHALLGYRERLALTSEQIGAIDSIGIWLQEANRPLSAELREYMGTGGSSRVPGRGGPRLNADALVLIERIAENNRAASEGVREVLSEEQRTQVCEVFAASGRAGGGGAMRQGSGGQRMPARAGAPGMAPGAFARGVPWSWCASQSQTDA